MDNPSSPEHPLMPSLRPVAAATEALVKPASLFTRQFSQVLLVQLSFGLSFSAYFLMPKYLATEFGATAGTIGAGAAAPVVAGVLASPFIGAALDRFGRRSLLLYGAAIGAVTSLAMAAVTSVGVFFYAVRAIQGVGFAFVFNAAAALVADRSPPARLGHAMGLLGAASLVTNAIGPGIGEHVAHDHGWAPVFIGTAAMSVLTFALSLGVEDYRGPTTTESIPAPEGSRKLNLVSMVLGAAFGTLMTFTQPLALERGVDRVAGFFVGYTVAALLVRIGLGSSVDRMGKQRVARGALTFYGIVTVAAAAVMPGLLEILGFAFGIAHGLVYPALAAIVAERSHPSRRGRALTTFNAAFNGGCSLSLLGCGLLAHHTGYAVVFVGVGLFTVAAAAGLRAPKPAESRAQ